MNENQYRQLFLFGPKNSIEEAEIHEENQRFSRRCVNIYRCEDGILIACEAYNGLTENNADDYDFQPKKVTSKDKEVILKIREYFDEKGEIIAAALFDENDEQFFMPNGAH